MRNRNGSRFHSVLLTLLPVLIVLPFFIALASGQQGLLIQKTWGNVGDQLGRRVAVDDFGNTYMTGTGPVTVVNGTMPYAAFLLKYDSTGNIVWEKSVGVPSNLISDV